MKLHNTHHPVWSGIRSQILWAPFRMLEADHALLLKQIAKLRRILFKWRRLDPDQWPPLEKAQVRSWLEHHRRHLATHFHAEEQVIFPYLAQHEPRLVPILTKLGGDHREIRRRSLEVEIAFQMFGRPPEDAGEGSEFCRSARALLRLIDHHVRQEVGLMHAL